MISKRIQRLYDNYHRLRAVGYSNAEATRLKHHSRDTVEYFIQNAHTILVDYRKERLIKVEEALINAKQKPHR